MRPSEALDRYRRAVIEAAGRYGLANVRVFGSAARGDDTEASDLDLLVEPAATTSLFDLLGLEIELEDLLGVRVEVMTRNDLHPAFREEAVRSAVIL